MIQLIVGNEGTGKTSKLLEKVNAFIDKIMADGTFDDICNHYFGDGEPVPVKSAAKDASKDQLVVATNAGFEPFEYTSGDSYLGIDMEIAQLLADRSGSIVVQVIGKKIVLFKVSSKKENRKIVLPL